MNDLGSEIQSLSWFSAIDQSLPLKVIYSNSQTQTVPWNSAVDQSHCLDVTNPDSKLDSKVADKVLPEASINVKNQEVFTANVAPNIKIFPSFVKINSDAPTLEKNERTYKYDNANFRYRGSNLSDIQRKEI